MTELYDQDAGRVWVCPECHDDDFRVRATEDRRSTARRQADRSIIADQEETIKLLEGRLSVCGEMVRRLQRSVDNWDRWADRVLPRADGDS